MKRVIIFLRFWEHFIVGDDSTIAIVVMWTLLLVWSLIANLINAWYILPLMIVALICFKTIVRQPVLVKVSPLVKLFVSVIIPMIIVTSVPLILFRYMTNTSAIHQTWLPCAMYIVIAMVAGSGINMFYRKFPTLGVFVAGFLTFLLIAFWQPFIIRTATIMSDNYPIATFFFTAVVPLLFVTLCVTLVQHRHDPSL